MLEFKNRQRDVWGRSYTELFFLDEVTALAAGHRPCFECRRKDAQAFAECWRQAFKLSARPRAGDMDDVLHRERLDGRAKRRHRLRDRRSAGRRGGRAGARARSRCAAARCCNGRRRATPHAGAGRAGASSTC